MIGAITFERFLSPRYKDDEKDVVILHSFEKEYKETRRIFDQEAAKIELVKEVIMLPVILLQILKLSLKKSMKNPVNKL